MIKEHLSVTFWKVNGRSNGAEVKTGTRRNMQTGAMALKYLAILLGFLSPLSISPFQTNAQNRRGPKVSAPASGAARKGALKKYVITCPVNIKAREPVEVMAKNSIEAMVSAMVALRCTVWTEASWKDYLQLEEDLKKICEKVGCGTPVPIQK